MRPFSFIDAKTTHNNLKNVEIIYNGMKWSEKFDKEKQRTKLINSKAKSALMT